MESGMVLKISSHSVFVVFLLLIGLASAAALTIYGWSYYLLPFADRPFSEQYAWMKPSGSFSHGLGIFGSLMVLLGVTGYSSRKRVRWLSSVGRLSNWLDIHIFLCLMGPVLVIYHTTFKVGGVAAITFWTMISVASSGIIGRFLYARIPRNVHGIHLSQDELGGQISVLGAALAQTPAGAHVVSFIDEAFRTVVTPASFSSLIKTLIQLERIKVRTKRELRRVFHHENISREMGAHLYDAALERLSLRERSLILQQVERFFFYWHAVHLPFTIIMFLTLAMHVVVVILLGYRWIG